MHFLFYIQELNNQINTEYIVHFISVLKSFHLMNQPFVSVLANKQENIFGVRVLAALICANRTGASTQTKQDVE